MRKEGAGLYAAAPIWHDFMQKAYEVKTKNSPSGQNPLSSPWEQTKEEASNQMQKPNEFFLPNQIEEFTKPETIYTDKPILNGYLFNERTIKIDKISGKLATDLTPADLIEEKKYKEVHTILYYLNKDNPQGEKPDNPTADPQFFNWEQSILQWLKNPNRAALVPFNSQIPLSNEQPPTEYDPLHTTANQPQIKIIAPVNNSRLANSPIKIEVQTYAPLGIKQIDFFFDDRFIGTDLTEPYGLLFKLSPNVSPGEHAIKVTAYDQALNRQQDEISVVIAP